MPAVVPVARARRLWQYTALTLRQHIQLQPLYHLFRRTDVWEFMRKQGWVGTVAGASVRYRRRVQMFHKVEMRSRIVGRDAKFLYVEQAMFRESDGECTSHVLLRTAVTDRKRMITMDEVAEAWGGFDAPPLPDWARAWSEADALRPWPPMQ